MAVNSGIWIVKIKDELISLGFTIITKKKKNYEIIECRILDIFKQSLMFFPLSSPKRFLYQHLIDNLCLHAIFLLIDRLIIYCKFYKFPSLFKGRHLIIPQRYP